MGADVETLPKDVVEAQLSWYEEKYKAGDVTVLFSAIRFCGVWKVIMPEWLVDAFHHVTNDWYSFEVRTLDDAFKAALPKGAHLSALKRSRQLALPVYLRVKEEVSKGRPVDEWLFEEIGKEFGIGKTLASTYYYKIKNNNFRKK